MMLVDTGMLWYRSVCIIYIPLYCTEFKYISQLGVFIVHNSTHAVQIQLQSMDYLLLYHPINEYCTKTIK